MANDEQLARVAWCETNRTRAQLAAKLVLLEDALAAAGSNHHDYDEQADTLANEHKASKKKARS